MIDEVARLEDYMKTNDYLNGCSIAKYLLREAEEKATTIQERYIIEVAEYAMDKWVSWDTAVAKLSIEHELHKLQDELYGVLRKLDKIMQRLNVS
jgi:hypothetical protein